MSFIAILITVVVLLVIGLLSVALIVQGRRERDEAAAFLREVRDADHELEQARALDKGWHPERLEAAARATLAQGRPGWDYERLRVILVDDRPGVAEDRAQMAAVGGGERVILGLTRSPEGDWSAKILS
jgi:hypothetical protein